MPGFRAHLPRVINGLTPLALAAALLAPVTAHAAIFASAPSDSAAALTFKTAPGSMTGKWISRSIAVTGDSKTSLAKMSLGQSEFNLVEQHGKITGTRPGAVKGKTYEVTGLVVYGPRRAPQVVLHSTSEVNGKTYEYNYFGYLMPTWNVSASQPDTLMGSVVRTDPSAPDDPAIVVSFIATREGGGGAAAAGK